MRRPFHSAGETCRNTDVLPGSPIVLVFVFQLTSRVEQAFHPAESSLKCEKAVPPSSQNTHVGRKIRPCGHNVAIGKATHQERKIGLLPGFLTETTNSRRRLSFLRPRLSATEYDGLRGAQSPLRVNPLLSGWPFPHLSRRGPVAHSGLPLAIPLRVIQKPIILYHTI